MKGQQYLNILKKNLFASAKKIGIRRTFKLYQDNDPKHTCRKLKDWCLYNYPKVIKAPVQSPDINLIENV